MKKKNNVLIIGGTGFVGFHLCKYFLKQEYKVFSISLNKPKEIRKLKNVKYFTCNISKFKEIIFCSF